MWRVNASSRNSLAAFDEDLLAFLAKFDYLWDHLAKRFDEQTIDRECGVIIGQAPEIPSSITGRR
jgi:hypothetical protein